MLSYQIEKMVGGSRVNSRSIWIPIEHRINNDGIFGRWICDQILPPGGGVFEQSVNDGFNVFTHHLYAFHAVMKVGVAWNHF